MRWRLKSRKHTLKFVALFTGTILWFYVLNAARIRVEKTVTLQYVLPEYAVFANKPPQEAIVVLEGPRAFMRPLLDREEKLVVDLTKPQWRDNLRPHPVLDGNNLALPFGIKVEKITPKILPLRLERKSSRIVPVKITLTGELPEDLKLTDMQVKPQEVEVMGPRSLVAGLKEAPTRLVDIESLYGQNSLALEWNLPDERLIVARGTTPTLEYNLKATRANLVIEKVPIRILGEGRLSYDQNVSLVLWAPPDMARRVNKADLNVQVWAEVPERLKKSTEVTLRAVLPPRLHLVEIRPKRVLVEPP